LAYKLWLFATINLHKTAFNSIFKVDFTALLNYKKYTLLFCVFCFALISRAQNSNNFYLEKKLYTYINGLPGRAVRQITQDSKGFMWLITNNGLCRFDGKEFKVFTQQTDGLFNNNISSILSDNGQGIIINYFSDKSKFSISNEHIDVIDINTLKVKSLKQHYKNVPFNEKDIAEIRTDPDENNILCFLKGYDNRKIETYKNAIIWRLDSANNFTPKKWTPTKAITFIRNGKNVMATVEPYSFLQPFKNHAMFAFDEGSIMAREGYHAKLMYKDDVGGTILRYSDSISSHYFYLFENNNSIKEIYPNDSNYLWFILDKDVQYFDVRMNPNGIIYRQNNALNLYYNKNELISIVDSTDTERIKKAQILSVFKDKIGNYWVSTSEGALKISIKQKKFHQLFTYNQIPKGLNNSTRGFYKKKEGLLVAAFDFIGIKNNNATQVIKNYYNFNFCESSDQLFVASSNLEALDFKLKKIEKIHEATLGEFWSLFSLNANQLLVGTANGIAIYNKTSNLLSNVDSGAFQQSNITYRFFNYQNNIIAVASNGIYLLNKQGKIIDCYYRNQKDVTKRLLAQEINDLHIDKSGLFWICTAFDGLYCWDKKNNTVEQFGIEHGFLSTTHYRIEEDDFNNLWISTDFGLAKFNKKTKRAKIYTEADGISHNEFNRVSSFKDVDGTLYFGGMNGVTYFHPKDFFEEENIQDYSFVVNNLSLYNSTTNLMEDETKWFFENKEIVLQGNKKNATIEVALLDLEDRVHTYAYQIEGLDKEWNYIKDGNIKLNNLPFGKYTLIIKAQCLNGLWNKTEISIPIIIPVPFYKTLWFMVFIVIVVIALIFVFIFQRTKLLKKQNEKLEQIVEVRTAELKASLAEQIALLQEVHHRVKNNLQFIAAMLKMQINSIKDEGNQAVLKETSRRINSMSLVHEMLYNKEKLEFVSTKDYLTELVSKFNEMVYDNKEPIKFNLSIEDVKFDINNCVAIGMITSEIISNAIKYAFTDKQNAVVAISLVYNSADSEVVFSISDNGIGLSQSINQSGIGMRLIDIFSRQMEAEYESKNENGLKYIFTIPYQKNE